MNVYNVKLSERESLNSLTHGPLFLADTEEQRGITSIKGRFFCCVGIVFTVIPFPLEVISNIGDSIKKTADLGLIIISFGRVVISSGVLDETTKQAFKSKKVEVLDSFGSLVYLLFSRVIVLARLSIGATLYPRAALGLRAKPS